MTRKKIFAIIMAVAIISSVFAMTVSASYIQLLHLNDTISNITYHVYLSEDTSFHYYEMDAWAWGGTNVTIRLQCTVGYSDGSYDQTFENNGVNSDNAVVFYDASKTVTYVDIEMHIYDGSTYIDTVSDIYRP